MHMLENVYIGSDRNLHGLSLPGANTSIVPILDFRGFLRHDRRQA